MHCNRGAGSELNIQMVDPDRTEVYAAAASAEGFLTEYIRSYVSTPAQAPTSVRGWGGREERRGGVLQAR